MTDRDDLRFDAGTVLTGKWHGHRYQIVRRLGSGAQGMVYLARACERKVAVKMAKDRASLISEVNVLKKLETLRGEPLGPSLFDSDDWIVNGRTIGFCAMEYLEGTPLQEALKRTSFDWTVVYLVQLLKHLQRLHETGHVFGDLKPENLMLMNPGHSVRFLDFGGATRIGRSVREYTVFFDRGYWGLGTRKAEPGYDLFACGMIMIYAALGHRFEKKGQGEGQLLQVIRTLPRLAPYQAVLAKALKGRYVSADQMRRDLLNHIMEKQEAPAACGKRSRSRANAGGGWLGAWVTASCIMTAYVLFVIVYVM
ncbi:serine/threonine protein kinase [Sporolactobacillus putidus]|uniref:Protein kinase domain-containing protein n=1 Tax=Sporolactobacillus putidus TaxID=492735 RepID=A0A917W513_9BACL|nr:protein kinase [Sporolactobacillus putidus]GGL64229.1 hypothetical protein GCM10007968_30210 [Sporolactobacillus putidus]